MSIGKIAIFHNLKEGGGKKYIFEIAKSLYESGYNIDLFTLDPNAKKDYYYNLICLPHYEEKKMTSFLLNYPKYVSKIKNVAIKIENGNYDLILVTHCYISQTPPIFEFIKQEKNISKTIYIFHELKREFYEQTSLDHYNLKRWIARMIRIFLKFREIKNISLARTVISNSYFSKYNLLKRIGKNSIVLNPLHQVKTIYTDYDHRRGFSSIITGGYTKGKHITDKILSNSPKEKITYIGATEDNTKNVKYYNNIDKTKYISILSKSKYYIANNIDEPLGLATIDAILYKNILFASNSGSHNELIKLGINGFLYPGSDIQLAKKVVASNMHQKLIKYTSYYYDWRKYSSHLLSLCKK